MSERKTRRGFGEHRGPGGPGVAMAFEKPKDFSGTLKRILSYLKPHAWKIIVVFLAAAVSTVFMILAPDKLGQATTELFKYFSVPGTLAEDVFSAVFDILLVLGGYYLLSALFNWVQQFIMAGVSQRVVYDLREEVDQKLSRLPLKYFDGQSHGDVLSRVTNDVDTIAGTLQQSLTQTVTSVVTLIGVTFMMFKINWILAIVVLCTLPLSALAARFVVKHSQRYFLGQQTSLGDMSGHVEEIYGGHRVVKAYGLEEDALHKFNGINERLYESGWRSQFISGIMMPLLNFVGNFGYVIICVLGSVFVTKGRMTIGNVQSFIQYARQFTQPINQTANIANVIQSTVAAAERVFEIMDEPEQVPDTSDPKLLSMPQGHVTFEDVAFSYSPDTPLIDNLNIEVRSGQTVAIVGPTGAGKTTLVNLLMRFYELDEGRILIDGVDIREMPRDDLRSLFGMVLQDTWLFNGTIRENIAYSCNRKVSDEEIHAAAKAAYADRFIRTLPHGYDTVINEEASNISQGQKQLLTIARAILADPPILILDEATSNVDTRTEVYIQRAMNKLMVGRTSFVIAHRLSTIKEADLILVMNAGHVIEQGTHQELLEQKGFYADLYNSQFAGQQSA